MNPIVRWCRFNLVGAIGAAVQLGALSLLSHVLRGHYLVATALALEITLLHNFAWHVGYTWRDRRIPQEPKPLRGLLMGTLKSRPYANSNGLLRPLSRFHLTNGLVSYLGNLALMRLLVEGAHMRVVPANGIAIACCSIVNFLFADRWAFVTSSRIPAAPGRPDLVTLSAVPPPAPN